LVAQPVNGKFFLLKIAANTWQLNKVSQTTDLTGTILTTDWSGSAPATATVTVNGLTANDSPIADLVLSSTYANWEAEEEAWAFIKKATTGTNQITFSASEVPEVNLNFTVKVVR
jgi:hypothetical protein